MRSPVPIDIGAARTALASAGERAADLIASAPDMSARVPDSDWTVGETAAHMVVALSGFTGSARGITDWGPMIPDIAHTRDRLVEVNARSIGMIHHDDAGYLAAQLTEAREQFLEATAALDPAHELPTPWYGASTSLAVDAATCLLTGEQLVHGLDIARALERPWPIDAGPARLIIAAVTALLPGFVDTAAVGDLKATFDVAIRGGPRFTVAVAGGQVTFSGGGAVRADCHISADPVAFVLVGYGRTAFWGAAATGKLLAWGRKPWLGLRFPNLFLKP